MQWNQNYMHIYWSSLSTLTWKLVDPYLATVNLALSRRSLHSTHLFISSRFIEPKDHTHASLHNNDSHDWGTWHVKDFWKRRFPQFYMKLWLMSWWQYNCIVHTETWDPASYQTNWFLCVLFSFVPHSLATTIVSFLQENENEFQALNHTHKLHPTIPTETKTEVILCLSTPPFKCRLTKKAHFPIIQRKSDYCLLVHIHSSTTMYRNWRHERKAASSKSNPTSCSILL